MNLADFSAQVAALEQKVRRDRDRDRDATDLDPLATCAELDTALEELRVAEEELRRQLVEIEAGRDRLDRERRRYADFFEHSPTASVVTDLHGTIRRANAAFCDLLGLAPRFVPGKPLAVYVPEEGRAAFRSELTRLARGADAGTYAMRLGSARIAPRPVTAQTARIAGDPGGPDVLLWSFRDDSLIRAAEDRLRHQNQELEDRVRGRTEQLRNELAAREDLLMRLHAEADAATTSRWLDGLVHGLDAIVWAADPATGRLHFVSRHVRDVLGIPPERWMNEPHARISCIHPDDREYVAQCWRKALEMGRPVECEYRMIAADGRPVWFREGVRLVDDPAGRRHLCGLMVNISRRKRAERQLLHAKQELAEEVRELRHLHALTSRLGSTLELEEVLEEILESALGLEGALKGALLLYHPESDDLTVAAFVGFSPEFSARVGRLRRGQGACGRVLATGEPVIIPDTLEDPGHAEFLDLIRDEGFRGVFSYPLKGRDGRFLGTLSSCFDEPHRPTDRQVDLIDRYARLAADAIENARRYREARDESVRRERFLAVLAHELRNPLSAMRAAAHLIALPEAVEADRAHAVGVIDRQVVHLGRMVEDLLDASRVALGKVTLHREPVDAAAALAEAAAVVRPQAEAKAQRLRVAPTDAPAVVEADPTRLHQVLVNLLANAVRYSGREAPIDASAARDGDEVLFRVRDRGHGIAADRLGEVFDLFSQLEPGRAGGGLGLGIGLNLVRGLVEQHGGRVEVASEGPGLGSEFIVRLPAVEPAEDAPEPPAPPAEAEAGPRHLLVVDDHADAATLLARVLRAEGHRVDVAHDAATALAMAEADPPDAAIIDLRLPGADGFEVARRLRDRHAPIRLVALSGSADADAERRIAEAGFERLLAKPVDLTHLHAWLRSPAVEPSSPA